MDPFKIADVEIFRFQIPLVRPYSVKGKLLSVREGLILKLFSRDGSCGLGEISPLPGLSSETLAQVLPQTLALKLEILNKPVPEELEQLSGGFSAWVGGLNLFPSVQFGFETAVLNLIADSRNILLYRLLKPSSLQDIPVIGLLDGATEDVVQESQRLLKQGFKNFKLKIGHPDLRPDIEKVKSLTKIFPRGVTLRLDANQSWTLAAAIRFAKEIPPEAVEYIEEPFARPLADLSQITHFHALTRHSVALDESLAQLKPERFHPVKGLKALILKPTFLGGIEQVLSWGRKAKESDLTPVLSSSFETGVGLSVLAHLAALHNCSPAGIDTLKWFERDILKNTLNWNHGRVNIPPQVFKRDNFNLNALTEVFS